MKRIYDNIAHPEIELLVENDLSEYGQHNQCPMSLTVVNDDLWRHYELGAIYGFVLYNTKDADGSFRFWIASVCEDDENWFAPISGMLMSAAWTNALTKTWLRMVEWQRQHIIEGFDSNGDYVRKVIKKIVPERIDYSEEPDNGVLNAAPLLIDSDVV